MNFFKDLESWINNLFSILETSSVQSKISQLGTLIAISITLFVMYKGFQILFGKSKDPIRELIWDLTMKAIIITFALNVGGWLDLVINAMKGLYEWAGGGTNLYSQLDVIFDKTRELADIVYDKAGSGITDAIVGTVYMILVYIGFLIGILPSLIIIITTTFTLKLLILIAPMMFFSLMYGWTKNMFTQWLSLVFANTFTVLFVATFFGSVITIFQDFIVYSQGSDTDPAPIVLQVIVTGIILSMLVGISKVLAERLAQASMESAMSSKFGQALAQSGAVAGGMAATPYMAGRGAYKLGKYLNNKKSQSKE
jgi:type IV secretion system protein VirB6